MLEEMLVASNMKLSEDVERLSGEVERLSLELAIMRSVEVARLERERSRPYPFNVLPEPEIL